MPPQQFGGATQSGPKSAYWNPYQARLLDQNIPSLWKAWITGSLIFSEVSNFSSEAAAEEVLTLPLQALGVDVEEVPHGTHVALLGRLMDVLASGHEPNPLGAAGSSKRTGERYRVDTPLRTGKPELKKQRRY